MKRNKPATEPLEKTRILQEILVKPGHIIIGHVQDGHIHVADIVHDGISEVSLTGQTPDLNPIPVKEIEAIRKKYGLHDPIKDDPIEDNLIIATQE